MAQPVRCSAGAAALFLFFVLLLAFPASADPGPQVLITETPQLPANATYTIKLFIPTASMIHSDQILDQINGRNSSVVLFATTFGLSMFNGTAWETLHASDTNISAGLMDDYVTAAEFDPEGNLWLGYSGGIQIWNGNYYRVIRDQQLLKDPRIKDLQRWNNDMWVATGNSGIHRYRNGTWTWFQPYSKNGPQFYEIDSMKLDPVSDALLIATHDNGLWMVKSPEDPVKFEQIAGRNTPNGKMEHVRQDPMGGVYFFNRDAVVHYRPTSGFVPVLSSRDLFPATYDINDLAAGPDGKLYIGTDNGLVIWEYGGVKKTLGRFEGIGESPVVKTVYIDSMNRVWFSTPGSVGYYTDLTAPSDLISIERVTPTPEPTPEPADMNSTENISPENTAGSPSAGQPQETVSQGTSGNASIFDPIARAFDAITSGIFGKKTPA